MEFYVLRLRSAAKLPAAAHKTIFAPINIYYFVFKPS
jgi:hypothetical protein